MSLSRSTWALRRTIQGVRSAGIFLPAVAGGPRQRHVAGPAVSRVKSVWAAATHALPARRIELPAGVRGMATRKDGFMEDAGARMEHKTDMREFLRQEIAEETAEELAPEELTPPGEWKLVQTGESFGQNNNIVLMLEKRFGGKETVSVITSTEVLVGGDEDDMLPDLDDEDEDVFDDFEEKTGVSSLLLVAIKKDSFPGPLYVECVFDRYGVDISRAHVGLGCTGFMTEQGAAATLYHAYMERVGEDVKGEVEEPMEESPPATSPPFSDLDDQMQAQFKKLLSERGVNTELTDYVMDALDNMERTQYVNFLTKLEDWVAN